MYSSLRLQLQNLKEGLYARRESLQNARKKLEVNCGVQKFEVKKKQNKANLTAFLSFLSYFSQSYTGSASRDGLEWVVHPSTLQLISHLVSSDWRRLALLSIAAGCALTP